MRQGKGTSRRAEHETIQAVQKTAWNRGRVDQNGENQIRFGGWENLCPDIVSKRKLTKGNEKGVPQKVSETSKNKK